MLSIAIPIIEWCGSVVRLNTTCVKYYRMFTICVIIFMGRHLRRSVYVWLFARIVQGQNCGRHYAPISLNQDKLCCCFCMHLLLFGFPSLETNHSMFSMLRANISAYEMAFTKHAWLGLTHRSSNLLVCINTIVFPILEYLRETNCELIRTTANCCVCKFVEGPTSSHQPICTRHWHELACLVGFKSTQNRWWTFHTAHGPVTTVWVCV